MTTLPNDKLRIAIAKIELGKIAIDENVVLKNRVIILEEKVRVLDSSESKLKKLDTTNTRIIAGFNMENGNLKKEVKATLHINEILVKAVKHWKGMTFKIGGISVAAIGVVTYLLVKK